MRGMKKATALILAVLMLVTFSLSMVSCNRSFKKDEVEGAAKELLPKALLLYSLYYGSGIGYMSTGFSDGNYREADPLSLKKYGVKTVEDIKTLTLATFSEAYSQNIFNKYLESFEANDTVYSYARYTQNAMGEYILVYKDHEPIFDDRMEYDLETVRAVDSKKKFINLTVEAIVKNEEGKSKRIPLKFTMFEEEAGWRISSPCFGNYN